MSDSAWTCARCLVPCGATEFKCPACQELRPGVSSMGEESSSGASHPRVQFGVVSQPTSKFAVDSKSNVTPGFGFLSQALPTHNPFGVAQFGGGQSPDAVQTFGTQTFGGNNFGQISGSPVDSSVSSEKENLSNLSHQSSPESKVDGSRFTFGASQGQAAEERTPAVRESPPSGQPSPVRFLDALATTPKGTSGPDSPLLREYGPNREAPAAKRDCSKRGILYTWGSGECDQLALRQELIVEGMRLEPALIRRVNQPIAKQITCGTMHSACIIDNGKTLYTWGCNDEKALGRPIKVDTKRKNAQGEIYDVKPDGPLIDPVWLNVTPPKDDPNYYLTKAPGPVWGLPDNVEIVKVTAGDSHTAIITSTGDCYCWGTYRDGTGPLGFPDFSSETPEALIKNQFVPIKIPNLTGSCIRLVSGENHTLVMTYCAGDSKYRLYGWGANPYGQLAAPPTTHENGKEYLWPREIKISELEFEEAGDGDTTHRHPKYERIRKGSIADIYGGRATVFLSVSYEGGTSVFGMGRNACGELGAGFFKECVSNPLEVRTPHGFVWKEIKGGDWFTLGVTHDGAVFSWGHCEYIGQGSEIAHSKKNIAIPRKVPGLGQRTAEIATSDKSAYVVTFQGELFTWGENQSGQLGLGRQEDLPVSRPTFVAQGKFQFQPVLSIAAGAQHAVAMVQAQEHLLERGVKRRREEEEPEVLETKKLRANVDPSATDDRMLVDSVVRGAPEPPVAEISPAKEGYESDEEADDEDLAAEETEEEPARIPESEGSMVPKPMTEMNEEELDDGEEEMRASESSESDDELSPSPTTVTRGAPPKPSVPKAKAKSARKVPDRKRAPLASLSHTPVDAPSSDLSQPPSEANAPKRTRAIQASSARKRQASASPPPAKKPRTTRKPAASQEVSPASSPVMGPAQSKRGRSKTQEESYPKEPSAKKSTVTVKPKSRSKAALPPPPPPETSSSSSSSSSSEEKKGAPPKARPQTKVKVAKEESVPRGSAKAKPKSTKSAPRTLISEQEASSESSSPSENEEEIEVLKPKASTKPKPKPKNRAASKPKAKAKAKSPSPTESEGSEDSDSDPEPQRVKKKGVTRSQPVVPKPKASARKTAVTTKSQPMVQQEEEVKKPALKKAAKPKMARRVTRSQTTESDATEPRKTSRTRR